MCIYFLYFCNIHFCVYSNRMDCGVFIMKLMETWRPDVDSRTVFSHYDILNIRILLANKLYFYPKNQVDLSLVTDFYSLVNVCFCSIQCFSIPVVWGSLWILLLRLTCCWFVCFFFTGLIFLYHRCCQDGTSL